MDGLVTLSVGGFAGEAAEAVPYEGRVRFDPAQPPDTVIGNRAVYTIADPEALFEVDGSPLSAPAVTIEITDDLNVQGRGILFVDRIRVEFRGTDPDDPWVFEAEPVSADLETLRGTGLPSGPFDLEDIGESSLVNRLFLPSLGPGFRDAPLSKLTLGAGPPPVTTGEAREVARLYEVGLDRDGVFDLEGLNFWIDARERGLDRPGLAQAFLDAPEFADRIGPPDGFTDRGLVERLYLSALERPGDEAGIGFWTGRLGDPDFGRPELLIAFAESVEKAEQLAVVETLVEVDPGFWDFVA